MITYVLKVVAIASRWKLKMYPFWIDNVVVSVVVK